VLRVSEAQPQSKDPLHLYYGHRHYKAFLPLTSFLLRPSIYLTIVYPFVYTYANLDR